MIKQWCLIIIALASMAWSHDGAANQPDDAAFIQLEGGFMNAQLIIDNNPSIKITSDSVDTFSLQGKTVARVPVSHGKHSIKMVKANKVIVDWTVNLPAAKTFAVVVP